MSKTMSYITYFSYPQPMQIKYLNINCKLIIDKTVKYKKGLSEKRIYTYQDPSNNLNNVIKFK